MVCYYGAYNVWCQDLVLICLNIGIIIWLTSKYCQQSFPYNNCNKATGHNLYQYKLIYMLDSLQKDILKKNQAIWGMEWTWTYCGPIGPFIFRLGNIYKDLEQNEGPKELIFYILVHLIVCNILIQIHLNIHLNVQ